MPSGAGGARADSRGGGEVRRAAGDFGERGARDEARASDGGGDGERSLEAGGRSRSGERRAEGGGAFATDMGCGEGGRRARGWRVEESEDGREREL